MPRSVDPRTLRHLLLVLGEARLIVARAEKTGLDVTDLARAIDLVGSEERRPMSIKTEYPRSEAGTHDAESALQLAVWVGEWADRHGPLCEYASGECGSARARQGYRWTVNGTAEDGATVIVNIPLPCDQSEADLLVLKEAVARLARCEDNFQYIVIDKKMAVHETPPPGPVDIGPATSNSMEAGMVSTTITKDTAQGHTVEG